MAYKTKAEKRAYKTGLLNGLKRKKKTSRKKTSRGRRHGSDNPFGMSYAQMLRESTQAKIDLLGDFEYDSRGRMKGSYTPDGFFEPD